MKPVRRDVNYRIGLPRTLKSLPGHCSVYRTVERQLRDLGSRLFWRLRDVLL